MKMLLAALISALLLASCGKMPAGPQGPAGVPGERGLPGVQGEGGKDGHSLFVEPIILCPELPGDFPEILIRIDGKLFAVYSDKKDNRLIEVKAGNYITTDGRNCRFSVDDKGVVY